MSSLAGLCLDLFLMGHAHLASGQAGDGFGFERRVRSHLDALGLPTSRDFRVFGRRSLSGIYHQLDEQTSCREALVVGEWKSYTEQIPKNDLLRFKAATDDYWLLEQPAAELPVVRVFGGTGRVTEAMRTYAAHWGIVLITPDRWPIPALCDQDLLWGPGDLRGPAVVDQRTLASLIGPLGAVLVPQEDGSWRIPTMAAATDIAHRLKVWEHWSDVAWSWWDDGGQGRFESLLEGRMSPLIHAAA